jgi:hypothetical protein
MRHDRGAAYPTLLVTHIVRLDERLGQALVLADLAELGVLLSAGTRGHVLLAFD